MEEPECPLCLEPLAIDDINFYPCDCRYQICRFCWHRIRTNEGGRCPHCRTIYSENPAEYTPPSPEQVAKLKGKSKKKNHDKKQKIVENRKNLSEVRVVQKNLVFVLGLSPRLADPEILKKHEYFGRFGKIHKVVINHHTVYNGTLGPSVSAYVTYQRSEDATRAIQTVNNAFTDGRYLKASYGTTKYCSFFLRGLQCTKADCMYLHELGDEDASFTKEDMQQGKHQDYEVATLEASTTGSSSIIKDTSSKRNSTKNKQASTKSNASNKVESALPSSANWGKKSEKTRTNKPVPQKQQSVEYHHHQPLSLQRTHSHPAHSASHAHEDNDGCGGKYSGTIHSLSSSSESLKSATSSVGSKKSNSLPRCPPSSSIDNSNANRRNSYGVVSVSSDIASEEHDLDVFEGGTALEASEVSPTESNDKQEDEEEHESEDHCANDPVWNDSDTVVWSNSHEGLNGQGDCNQLTVDVFKTLGSTANGEFGSLGVSWQGQPHSSEPSEGLGHLMTSLPWDASDPSSSSNTTTLASLLNQPSHTSHIETLKQEGLIDEKQRLASASYVNYGPTTNNPLEELHAQKTKIPSSGRKGETLRTTLEDGFLTMFPGIQSSSLENAIDASSLIGGPSSSNESSNLFGLFRNSSKSRNEVEPGDEWLNNKCTDNSNSSSVPPPPPPGFGPQKSSSLNSENPSSYSLWGGEHTNSVQELLQYNHHQQHHQQQGNIVPPHRGGMAPTIAQRQPLLSSTLGPPRPVPAGAIPHNLLEASLFNTNTPTVQQQQLIQQQQALKQQRTLALQQQQRYQKQAQLSALQQQFLLYQQHVLSAQQKQQHRLVSSYPGPPANYTAKQHKEVPLYSYFAGGWYPTGYTWGLPAPLTVNTTSSSNVRKGTASISGRNTVVSSSTNQIAPPPLVEQKMQNMSLK